MRTPAATIGKTKDIMNWKRIIVLLAVLSVLFLMGNSPPPYYACQGKAVGDRCTYGSGSACMASDTVCTLSDSFKDDPQTTDLNEQLICTGH